MRSHNLRATNVAITVCAFLPGAVIAQPTTKNAYVQHNLVSDVAGRADVTDPNLVDPWGISETASSPFWVSDHNTGFATLYNGSGAITAVVVKILAGSATTTAVGTPTGQVAGNGANWVLPAPDSKVASFIFATEDGTIAAWNSSVSPASVAVRVVDNSGAGAVYKGLASNPSGTPMLYAANFNSGKIDVFDASFNPTTVLGGFMDPNIPAGFAPFNIQSLGGQLYVTYAMQDPAKKVDVPGPGNGFVDIFDLNGNLIQRLVSNGPLNSPWGVAIAPAGWGAFGGAVLVGNFGDGTINAFNPKTGASLGTLQDTSGNAIVNPGLWALQFGNGKSGGDPNTLYTTSSVNNNDNQTHGLLAGIAPPMQITGIVNAAGYTGGTISPGEIVLLTGFSIGPSPLVAATIPTTGVLGATVGTAASGITSVTFNGAAAPALYASASATSVVVPYELSGFPSAEVVVTFKNNTSATFTAQVAGTAPGLFTLNETGTGEIVAFNSDGTLNGSTNPAARGTPVLLYGTGEGQTDPASQDGVVAGEFFHTPQFAASLTIGAQPATVVYAGSAVGSIAGILEIEAIVPQAAAGTPAGTSAAPVVLTIGPTSSQQGTTIFVH